MVDTITTNPMSDIALSSLELNTNNIRYIKVQSSLSGAINVEYKVYTYVFRDFDFSRGGMCINNLALLMSTSVHVVYCIDII